MQVIYSVWAQAYIIYGTLEVIQHAEMTACTHDNNFYGFFSSIVKELTPQVQQERDYKKEQPSINPSLHLAMSLKVGSQLLVEVYTLNFVELVIFYSSC